MSKTRQGNTETIEERAILIKGLRELKFGAERKISEGSCS